MALDVAAITVERILGRLNASLRIVASRECVQCHDRSSSRRGQSARRAASSWRDATRSLLKMDAI